MSPRPRAAALVAALTLAGLLGGLLATGPARRAHGNGHAEHDRQGWDSGRKADEIADRAATLRERLDQIRDRKEDNGTDPWCPKTRQEWDMVIGTLASYLALNDVWREARREVLRAEFTGPAGSPGNTRDEKASRAFRDRKDLVRGLMARLIACDRTSVAGLFPPDERINELASKSGVEILIERTVEEAELVERQLAGLEPLSVVNCPECKEQDNPRNAVPGSRGR